MMRRILILTAFAAFALPAFAQNQPPTISFWSPVPGITSTYEAPASVNLRVSAADPDGTVTRVEYYVNGALLGAVTAAPFSATWTGVAAGNYSVTAKAFDNLNATTISAAVTIAVAAPDAGNAAPSVAPDSPLNNSTYTAPAVLLMSASASDSNGTVNRVEYLVNNNLLCVRTAAPYGCSVGGVPAGTYTLTAMVFDNQGKAAASAARTLSVLTANPANAAPTITLASPLSNSVSYSPATVWLRVNAADSDGTINRVEYLANGGLLAPMGTPPYGVNWRAIPPGTYSVVARAYDNQGKFADSAPANVTVNAPAAGNAAPTISTRLPINNSTYEAPANIGLLPSAADSNGTINRVEYYVNGAFASAVMTAPYSFTFIGVPAGTWTWTAVAFDNLGAPTTSSAVTTSVMTPNAANASPSVSVAQPANGGVYGAPATVPILLNASDADGSINRVEAFVNNAWIASFTAPPYQLSLTNAGIGSYAIVARAYDNLGKPTTSAATTVSVAANTGPAVSITGPANNTVVQAPGTINLTATASDSDGTLTKVEFYRGTTLIATDTAAPYAASDVNVAAGSYSYTAKAYDNSGGITTSAAVSVKLNAKPTVSITAPANDTALAAPATVNLTAAASDSDGMLAKVEFYRGTTLIATGTAAPYAAADANVPAGSYSYTARAYDNDGGITTSAAIVVISNALPTVSITAPASNTVLTAPASVTLTAGAADSDGTISKVEFYRGTTLINTDTTAPYSHIDPNLAAGTYSYTAKAYDNRDGVVTSAAVTVISNSLPSASITAPASNTVLAAPASVTLTASAADSDGTISKVEFYRGTTLINTDTIAPYSHTDPNVPAGTYSYTAKAYDNRDGVVTSAAVTVISNSLPSASITAPANNAVFQAPAGVALAASAADSDGTISKVEFYRGTTLINTDTIAPYSHTDPNVPAGTYSYTARAYDNRGMVTGSAAVDVTVNGSPISISITSPANNAVHQLGSAVLLAASATGAIRKVEFYRGTILIATVTAAPYQVTASGLAGGNYQFTAKAFDDQNASTSSAPVNVIVNAPPTVSITAPANNAVLAAPASVTVTASPADGDGTISKVEFYNGATLVGTATAAPFNLALTNLGAGPYSFTARAYDNNGGVMASAVVNVTVSGGAAATPVIYQYDEIGRLIGVQH